MLPDTIRPSMRRNLRGKRAEGALNSVYKYWTSYPIQRNWPPVFKPIGLCCTLGPNFQGKGGLKKKYPKP